jgi:hypothetical protein
MTKFIQLNTFNVKVILCFLFIGAMRTSFGQCYSVQVAQPNCSGDLGQIQYSVLGCGCNYSTNGPWVFRIGTTPNFSNASAIFTSSLTSNPVFVFSNLPAGTYYVRAHYNNSTTKCTGSELSVVISSPPQIQLSSTLTSSSIDLTVTGGTPGYTYSWSNGATTEDLSNLSPGTYSVVVTDLNGCTETASYTVQNQNPVLSVNWAISNILCFGDQNGIINLTVAGGNAPYNVSWTGPVSGNPAGNEIANSGGSYLIANMPAGIYTVTVTDSNGNSTNISATITQPQSPLTLSTMTTNNLCFGAQTGAIDLTVSGGTGIYAYSWNTGAITQDITGLAAGLYMVTVIDANGCTATTVATITQPQSPLTLSTAQVNVLCNGANTGSINLTPTGGIPLYTYLWSNGSTLQDPQNLVAGTYFVTVTDANGCTAQASTTITQPLALLLSGSINGNNIDLSVNGGIAPYVYLWSNGATTQDLTNLSPGPYTVTVIDANNCTVTASYTVQNQNPTLSVASVISPVLCYGGQDGSIIVTAAGGNAPYNVSWSGPVSGNPAGNEILNSGGSYIIANIPAGTYTLTITDSNGNADTQTVTITQPQSSLLASAVGTNVLCNGVSTGSINLTVSGGTGIYTYVWNTGAITQDINGLTAGTFTVTVTDANGCTATTSATITQPSALVVTDVVSTAIPCGGSQGVVTVSAVGGTPAYIGTGNFTVSAGTHTFTVTDANGCTASSSATITEPLPLLLTGSVNGNNVDISVSGGTVPYNYSWSNGAVTQDLPNVLPGTYVVIVTDAFNCSISDTFTVDNAGLEQQHSIELQVFPNPAQGVVTILSSSAGMGNTYRISDCYGRNVAEGKLQTAETTFSIQALANGVYHLQLGANTVSFVVSH